MTESGGFEGPRGPIHPDPFGPSAGAPDSASDMTVMGAADRPAAAVGRPWLAFGAAALVLVVIGGGALAVRSFFATSVAAAEVMPADTEFFFSVDFLQFIEGDARKLNNTIISMIEASGEVDGADLRDVDGLIGEIDSALDDALGLDFTNDIRPWVGRTVSLSLTGVADDFNTMAPGDVPDVLLVVETRDQSAADQFLSDLAAGLRRTTGAEISQSNYGGVPIFIVTDDSELDSPLLFSRVSSAVVFGTRHAVEGAIDTGSGPSLADDEGFTAVMDSLPSDRLMSFYVNGSAIADSLELQGLAPMTTTNTGFEDAGMSVSVAEFGVRFDSVVLGDDLTGEIDLSAGGVAADLPANTLVMFGGPSVAAIWDAIAAELDGFETDDLLAEAKAETGIDFDRFLSLLDGPSALALVGTGDGLMAEELGYPLGVLGLMGTTRPAEVEGYLMDLADYVEGNGFDDLTEVDTGSGTFWIAGRDGVEAAVFGVDGDYLVAASSSGMATSIGSSPSLLDNDRLLAAAAAMEVDPSSVLMFVDTQALVSAFDPPVDVTRALAPLGPLAASSAIEDGLVHGVAVWLIDYVDESE